MQGRNDKQKLLDEYSLAESAERHLRGEYYRVKRDADELNAQLQEATRKRVEAMMALDKALEG